MLDGGLKRLNSHMSSVKSEVQSIKSGMAKVHGGLNKLEKMNFDLMNVLRDPKPDLLLL